MATKVPYESVSYQSRNRCQCDFCEKCRQRNAASLFVTAHTQALQDSQRQTNCCCNCHSQLASRDYNASLARLSNKGNLTVGGNGSLNASQAANRSGKARSTRLSGSGAGASKQAEQQEEGERALRDVDRLERLLLLEHKARVEAELAMQSAQSRKNGTYGTGKDLLPLSALGGGNTYEDFNGRSAGDGADNGPYVDAGHPMVQGNEAYMRSFGCPVTPPVGCSASHHLQHALQAMDAVGRDPKNQYNKAILDTVIASSQQYLQQSSKSGQRYGANTPPPDNSSARSSQSGKALSSYERSVQEKKAAKAILESLPPDEHPYGSGVVWVKDKNPNSLKTVDAASLIPANAYAQSNRVAADRLA